MRLLRGSTRHRAKTSRLSSSYVTGPGGSKAHLRVNLLKCEAETDHNAAGGAPGEVPPHRQAPSKKATVKWLLCVLVGIIASTAAICVVIAFAKQSSQSEKKSASTGLDPIELPGGHHIYSKQHWQGLEARSESRLLHPTPVVIVSHTETLDCHNFDKCSERVRRIQTGHIGKKGARSGAEIVDIGYNFLIGGDGNVYEGRGWDAMSFHKRPEGVLGISFIGNFNKHELTDGQIEAAQELLALGVKLEKLSPSYVLIAHNQTIDTDSPGQNVIKVIEKWPHWSPTYRIT